MALVASQPARNPSRSVGGFLAIALLLHLVLLALPGLQTDRRSNHEALLEVRLREEPRRPETEPARPSEPQLPDPAQTATTVAPTQPLPTDMDAPAESMESAQPHSPLPRTTVTTPDPRPLTAQRILDSLEAFDWSHAEPVHQELGRALEGNLSDDWWRPVLSVERGPFADAFLTGETEIVDRWLEPGGVHRVVIRTPDGHTMCGRQEPVNDFRPWEQMPMMFHFCGGGGKRR